MAQTGHGHLDRSQSEIPADVPVAISCPLPSSQGPFRAGPRAPSPRKDRKHWSPGKRDVSVLPM